MNIYYNDEYLEEFMFLTDSYLFNYSRISEKGWLGFAHLFTNLLKMVHALSCI
jgi:hypothetical protein